MFKKLVSNMPFSPGLVGQVGFYLKRLRQEEFVRRFALIFTALSIAVQMMTITVPPTHAQASSTNNIVYEAVSSKAHLLKVYDSGDTNGNKDIDDILKFYGITRNDLVNARETRMKSYEEFSGHETWTMGRKAFGKPGEFKQVIPTNEGPSSTIYVRPWARSWGSYTTDVIRGTTTGGQDFAIIMNCGNIVIALKDLPKPAPVQGDFRTTCEVIHGWAVDPRLPNSSVTVGINIDGQREKTLKADQPNAYVNNIGIPGDHGFTWNIPDRFIDGENHNVSVIAFEDVDARGISEGDKTLGSSNGTTVILADCLPEPPEPEEVTVCRPGQGIITITEDQVRPTDFTDLSMCSEMQICVNDQLITISRYEHDGEPTTCPQIEVCRDGVVITLTSDKREEGDLEPELCEEIQVCDLVEGLTVIQKKDYDEDVHFEPYVNAFGEATCEEPSPEFSQSKLARNITQNIDNANDTTAQPSDNIVYELTTANSGTQDGFLDVFEDIEDILEYADLVSDGGAEFDAANKTLTWADVEIKAGESVTHVFEVQVKETLPETAQSQASPASYDFEMTNVYGNTVNIKLPKPASKQVESFASSLPETGPAETSFFVGMFVVLVTYFYFRNRLITKELNMIRKEHNGV